MIGLDDVVHDYPEWFFLKLKAIHRNFTKIGVPVLRRDSGTGLWRILPAVLAFRDLFDTPHFNPYRRVRSVNPGFVTGRSKDSGYPTLAGNLAGLTSPDGTRLRSLAEDVDWTL